jgi:DNA-binding transcriptional LysR family regulator
LAPHLEADFKALAPEVDVTIRRMWLPDLERTVADIDGELDLAITCASVPDPPGIISEIFCAETLFVSLRPDHRLAARHRIDLTELAGETLGLHSAALFPAWALALRQVLESAGVAPPTAELADTDLSACRWAAQHDVDWILTTKSVAGKHMSTPMIPVSPELYVPYTLQWCPIRAASAAVGRFVDLALSVDVPPGWITQPDHLRHDTA